MARKGRKKRNKDNMSLTELTHVTFDTMDDYMVRNLVNDMTGVLDLETLSRTFLEGNENEEAVLKRVQSLLQVLTKVDAPGAANAWIILVQTDETVPASGGASGASIDDLESIMDALFDNYAMRILSHAVIGQPQADPETGTLYLSRLLSFDLDLTTIWPGGLGGASADADASTSTSLFLVIEGANLLTEGSNTSREDGAMTIHYSLRERPLRQIGN
jgi:hypothetical protein